MFIGTSWRTAKHAPISDKQKARVIGLEFFHFIPIDFQPVLTNLFTSVRDRQATFEECL